MTDGYMFLGAFAKFRKATVSCMSARPSVRMEQLGSLWTDFDETRYLSFFSKKIFIKIRQEKRILYMKTVSHLWQYLTEFFLE
jgi:hypothetical protein